MKTVLNSDATKVLRTSVKSLAKTNPTFHAATGARWYAWQKAQNRKPRTGGVKTGNWRSNADKQTNQSQSKPKNSTFEKMKGL